jgi:signal transduction histidine kinase
MGISILNVIAISFYKDFLIQTFHRNAERELKIAQYERDYPLSDYLKISEKPLLNKDLELVSQILDGKFVYLDWHIVYKMVKNFGINLFIWEMVLILSLSFLFYKLLWVHLKEREENRAFLEILLLSLSHKLGNFLASQRLNIEILKQTPSPTALARLENTYSFVEMEFKHTLNIIKNFKTGSQKKEKIDLKPIIKANLAQFKEPLKDKQLRLDLTDTSVKGERVNVEMIFYLLIENAIKYAQRDIFIQLKKEDNFILCLIKNDINPKVPKGSGIGLSLVHQLAQKYGIKLSHKEEDNFYILSLKWPLKKLLIPRIA